VLGELNGGLPKSRPMNTLEIIEEDGFGVFPQVLLPHETRRLIDDLDQSPLRRSKAGVRQALRHPSVAALAPAPIPVNLRGGGTMVKNWSIVSIQEGIAWRIIGF
jgi:hypothetical protein